MPVAMAIASDSRQLLIASHESFFQTHFANSTQFISFQEMFFARKMKRGGGGGGGGGPHSTPYERPVYQATPPRAPFDVHMVEQFFPQVSASLTQGASLRQQVSLLSNVECGCNCNLHVSGHSGAQHAIDADATGAGATRQFGLQTAARA